MCQAKTAMETAQDPSTRKERRRTSPRVRHAEVAISTSMIAASPSRFPVRRRSSSRTVDPDQRVDASMRRQRPSVRNLDKPRDLNGRLRKSLDLNRVDHVDAYQQPSHPEQQRPRSRVTFTLYEPRPPVSHRLRSRTLQDHPRGAEVPCREVASTNPEVQASLIAPHHSRVVRGGDLRE